MLSVLGNTSLAQAEEARRGQALSITVSDQRYQEIAQEIRREGLKIRLDDAVVEYREGEGRQVASILIPTYGEASSTKSMIASVIDLTRFPHW